MRSRRIAVGVLALIAGPLVFGAAGCASGGQDDARLETARGDGERSAPRAVTADIQAGIEKHIADETAAGNGYFPLRHGDERLRLRLVKVHTEYLANLGPERHFACVDLVTPDGEVYDVDFFLEGPAGDMTVTQTTVHKLNGKPYYAWEQNDDGVWHRVAIETAGKALLGVVESEDRFRFFYEFTLPEDITDDTRLWLPVAESDRFQTVKLVEAETPVPYRVLRDDVEGNKVAYMELDREHAGGPVRFVYDVHRMEKAAYEGEGDPSRHLRPERLVPPDPVFSETVSEVLKGKTGELVRARALYDHVIDSMKYQKFQPGYGRGDALYACDALSGNCTDYHAYFIALARAAGIPARFAIGSPVPSDRDDGGISGYHCWAEFHAEGKWWPVDISESDKYSALSTYYFGRHPANRIEFSRGRDLVVTPGPKSGPINFLAYPLLEVDGEQVPIKPFFSFFRGAMLARGDGTGD